MTFTSSHLYLTWHWSTGGAPLENGQTGMRFETAAPASQSLVNACATIVSDFWDAATPEIPADYRLIFLRLAQLGTDGLYVPGTIAYDYTYAAPVPGGGGTNVQFPLQVACVASLTTAFSRGRAHRGRMYLPPSIRILNSNYKWASAFPQARAITLAASLFDLNGAIGGPLSVMSKIGAGTTHAVTGVAIGDKPDIQRSRAKSVAETYYNAVLA